MDVLTNLWRLLWAKLQDAAFWIDDVTRTCYAGQLVTVGMDRSCDFILQGVCNSWVEASRMVDQANNGRRSIRVEGPRTKDGTTWYAVYCG